MRRFSIFSLISVVFLVMATPIYAQGTEVTDSGKWVVITAGFAMALASFGCALAQGKAITAACEGLARNPGAAPSIRFALLLGLVLIESLALYTLLIIFVKVTL